VKKNNKNKNKSKIKVFLIDDHPALRDGVRACLNDHGSFVVVGEAADDSEAFLKLKNISPDIILLDISLPSLDGGELAKRLRQNVPYAKIIAFSMHASREYVVRMARCGVHGYVMKDKPTSVLIEAIKQVYAGGMSFPPEMYDAILTLNTAVSPGVALTQREREVLQYIVQGKSNREIATLLGLSVNTISVHRANLMQALGIHRTADLVVYALKKGLVPMPELPDKKN